MTLLKMMENVIENEGGNNFQMPSVKTIHFSHGVHPSSLPIASDLVCEQLSSLKTDG